jgi:hypothetical protein
MLTFLLLLPFVLAGPIVPHLSDWDQMNLFRELAFARPLPDPLLQNIVNLPVEIIPHLMQYLTFEQAYEISIAIKEKDQPLNPLNRTSTNPLIHHNAHSDNQTAIKRWLNQAETMDRITHLRNLMLNPTVDWRRYGRAIALKAAEIGDEGIVRHFIKLDRTRYGIYYELAILQNACKSNNLGLVKYLIEEENITPDKYSMRNAVINRRRSIIRYLAEFHGLDPHEVSRFRLLATRPAGIYRPRLGIMYY